MARREVLSPLTNTPFTPLRQPSTKYVSPSTSRVIGLASPASVMAHFPDQDEGRQRLERRRKSQAFDFQRKNLGSPSSSSPNKPSDVLNGLTSTQLANHYADCIKLSAENKINAKNAFGLHLIDYMTELVKKKEMENFQVASSTLDASVKIYAGRVDFIHTHTYKVLSGLGGGKATEEEETVEGVEEGADVNEMDTKQKKKRKVAKAHTIETNLKNINVDKFDLEFEVDPMFQIMSAAFDEGGARGLLLNRLRTFDDSQQLVLDSSTVINLVQDNIPDSQHKRRPVSLADVKELLSNLNLDGKHICPSLKDFHFTNWNGESSEIPKGLSEFAFDPTEKPQHLPSVEEEMDAIAHEEIDDMDVPEDEQQDFGNQTRDPNGLSQMSSRTAIVFESACNDLSKTRQLLADKPSEFSYFNKILTRTWAGPAHWRIAPISRTAPTEKVVKKRQRKLPLVLTYDTPEKNLDKLFVISNATQISKKTWSGYTIKKTTLPEDSIHSRDRLFCLFHKPHVMVKQQTGSSIGVDDGIDNYDYNNKNDVENFCPVAREDDDDGDFSSGGFDLSNETHFPQASQDSLSQHSAFSSLNGTILTLDKLVAAPNKVVQKIDIKYAKTAKMVDVRKLKSTLWTILTKDSLEETSNGSSNEASSTTETLQQIAVPSKFSKLTNTLPSKVSTSMAKNLTIQTVFACLLYITNEKTLRLSGTLEMDDIHIEQDS
ncbi:unnamed protein product [Lymnaea stagnalis]|uniref:Condensin complex subunit 2 n=1 Tax=Lymnaea stagnalis TaxID=6523 RepID=A0AAV2HNN5_LYMST